MKRVLRYVTALVVVVITVSIIWWVGPWSRQYRYSHMGLLALKRLTDGDPNDTLAWRTMGLRLAAEGDGVAADRPLREAIRLDPKDAECATALGEILLASSRFPDAFQLLKSTAESNPSYMPAHMALGRLYMRRASYLNATKQFEAVTKIDSANTDAWFQLARCYLQMQQVQNAKSCIERANQLTPNSADILMVFAAIESATGKVESAIDFARRSTLIAPKNVKTHTGLANLLLAQSRSDADLEEASRELKTIETLQPNSPVLPYQKGELARRQNKFDEAAKYYEQALKSSPGMDEVYFSLSQVYTRLGRKAESDQASAIYRDRVEMKRKMDNLKIALGGKPDDPDLLVKLAELQAKAGDTTAAIANVRTVLAADPKNAGALALIQQYRGSAPSRPPK